MAFEVEFSLLTHYLSVRTSEGSAHRFPRATFHTRQSSHRLNRRNAIETSTVIPLKKDEERHSETLEHMLKMPRPTVTTPSGALL
jgi:hypothetical protein